MRRAVIFGAIVLSTLLIVAASYSNVGSEQSDEAVHAKSAGCLSCHEGIEPMHQSAAVRLGCVDCHGGDASATTLQSAHVQPRYPEAWKRNGRATSSNPERTYTALLKESAQFIRFINPGDLRVAAEVCGSCHQRQTATVPRSLMTTSSVFWSAVSYANGLVSQKKAFLGESYDREGNPQALEPLAVSSDEQKARGALGKIFPLPRWEIMQPGEIFRAFERGGSAQGNTPPDIGNPRAADEAGKPDIRLGNRGLGTGLRVSPALINLHKTRLNDPHLSFLGTNDHPGDYRSSGCSACHVLYANDRDPLHSATEAHYGNDGRSQSDDRSIPRDEPGHPLKHRFTRSIPLSQCMTCHMHQPNAFLNTYLGYTMWDYESDAKLFFPKQQRNPTLEEQRAALDANPEGAVVRGLWGDPKFLQKVSELNPLAMHTQFADYHGHGWNFMAVYKRDRKGNLLDERDGVVSFDDPQKFNKAVHLRDIHLEKGMQCTDCHFSNDNHGNGQLYGEFGSAVEIDCRDCHGSVAEYTNLRTSGPAAPSDGTDLSVLTTPFGQRRFAWVNGRLLQRSTVTPDLEWEVVQVKDTVTPGNRRYNERSRYAKTIQRNGASWGDSTSAQLAHDDSSMTCQSCHTSWMTSCSGCHLPQEQNQKSAAQHFEGMTTRNYSSYNPQVIRTDTFMLGVSATTQGHRIAPVRSSSALVVSSTNAQRQRIYIQQPPISAPGYSSQAFNTHVPHTVRSRETQHCDSCHLTEANDNNAWMAQLLLQGTNFVNLIGRYAYVGEGERGVEAIAVTEWTEPQTVIGSSLQQIVYPDNYRKHETRQRQLETAHFSGHGARSLQLRGEYLYAARGRDGFAVYDVANVDNKDFSEKIVSAPVSPLGQRTTVATRDARAVALPATMPMAPDRQTQFIAENEEQPIHPLYRYAYIADAVEGLILVDVTTLSDRNPSNNFLKRAVAFNPGGALDGAQSIAVAGRWVIIGARSGVVVVDVDTPLAPKIAATIPSIESATGLAVQFRYLFATNAKGLHSVDITDPARPRVAATLPLNDARSLYVARTYAYVAGGAQGMIIVDVERPDHPFVDQTFDAGGRLRDTNDIKVGSTNASTFAYIADGTAGFKVVQLTSPEWTPTYAGFTPRPSPRLIAERRTKGSALAVSKGLDRDRAVDESGNQVSIFNRIGARPMTIDEMQRLYLRNGKLYTVTNSPTTPALEPARRGSR
jgi:hypothetical protein